MPKIILFNPYCTFDDKTYVFYRASIPYHLLYLTGYLQKHGIESKIYELGIFNEEERIVRDNSIRCGISDYAINGILEKEKPGIVGISTMYTVFHQDYVEIIKTIKRYNPNIHIVVGGNHASVFPGLMLESGADQVVVGEGEKSFLRVCQGNREKIIRSEFIDDLDEIPFLPLDKIDLNQYISLSNPYVMRTPVMGIITSRGCPHNCIYCTANGVWQRKWRARSPENVVAEMKHMMSAYGIREFHILDDNVGVDYLRLSNICDLIIQEKLNIKWATPNGIAHWKLDKVLLDKMKQSGCYRVTFGIESGDTETRKFIGKNYPLAQAKDIIQYANKIGMWTITTNILGFPYEQYSSILNTMDFAKECGTDFATFFLLLPHPSSDVYRYYVNEGLFDSDDALSILNEGGCDSVYFSKGQLKGLQRKAYNEFVAHRFNEYKRHPKLLMQKIHSIEDIKYLIKLVRLGLSMRKRKNDKMTTTKDFIYGKRQYV